MLKNTKAIKNLVMSDHTYQFMRNVCGTLAYWQKQLYYILDIMHTIGTPTWFLTVSPAMFLWPEFIQVIGI